MVETGRGDVPLRRPAWKQSRTMHGGVSGQRKRISGGFRDEIVDGVEEKVRDWPAASSVDYQSSKQTGLVRCGERKMKRKSDGYDKCGFLGHEVAGIGGDCCVEDGYSVDKEVVDEEASDAGETPGTQGSSCVARRTRSQMERLVSGTKKNIANMLEDLILIDDSNSDNDGDGGDVEEKDEADVKGGVDMDDSAVLGNTEDKSKKNFSGLNLSVDGEEVEMRHNNIPVAKRTRQQIRMRCNEVFDKRSKSNGKLPLKTSTEIIDVYDDGSEDDSVSIEVAGEVEENTCNSLGNFVPSGLAHPTRSRVVNSNESADDDGAKDSEELLQTCFSEEETDVLKYKCYLVDQFGKLYSEDEAISTSVEDEEDAIICDMDGEDSVDRGRTEDGANENDSNEHKSLDGEGSEDSEELLLMCSSEKENDVMENRCYRVDEFGNSYSEDENISTFAEKSDGEDEGVNDYDGDDDEQEGDDDDDDSGGGGDSDGDDEEWEEGDDDKCGDESSEDDLVRYKSIHGEEGGNYVELLLSSSSEKENGFSMDHSANISRHCLPVCVARRTRSHFKMTRSDGMKAGTLSNPFCLDSENDDQKIDLGDNSSSGESNKRRASSVSKAGVKSMQVSEGSSEEHDSPPDRKRFKHADETGKIRLAKSASGNGDVLKQKSMGQGKRNVTTSKRKHISHACDARKVLLEAIWSQQHESMNIIPPKVTRITSRLFTFGEEDSEPPEKSKDELQLDYLWRELDFCLRCSELESGNTDTVENGNLLNHKLDSCLRGDHDVILDEEIGYRCRNCPTILQEICDVVAPFRKDPVERYVKRDYGRADDDLRYKLPNESKINELNNDVPSNHDDTVWDLVPDIKSTLFPHQQEGFEFIWKNLAGAVNISEVRRFKETKEGNGCIISHAPGTGKSRLTLVFLQAYLRFFPDCRPVIIAPKSMLLTWEEEFKKWNVDIPFHNLNNDDLSGKEDVEALGILARFNSGGQRKEILRMVKLYSWKCQSGVLGISYSLFEKLTLGRNTEKDDQSEGNVLLKLPGLLVLDEGHTPRNNDSLIWQALSNVQTQKRICLSGTPFQNNFDELFNTFCMARPRFAKTMPLRNKGNGVRRRGHKSNVVKANWANLTNSIRQNNVEELEILKAMISPFVHVYKGNVLQDTLPGLSKKAVYLRPGSWLKSLLQTADAIDNIIERRHVASLISVHPSLLLQLSTAVITRLFPGTREELQRMNLTTQDGAKTKFLIEFLRLADALKEKVLVFSDYIDPLMFLKDQLKSCFGWTEGEEILYMDGKLEARQRQASISTFNDEDSNVKVLLASTRACCEGISLIGASRVILLDAAWNPSVQRQAISRAYRIGQKRFVYVYYLITCATVEEDVYRQQVNKDRLSNMVFPLTNKGDDIDDHLDSTAGPEDKILLEMLDHSRIADSIEKVV